jgi:outer membrane protein OmpA-like peptidoglycan-associated protein
MRTPRLQILIITASAVTVFGCANVPEPPEVDGSQRIAINDADASKALTVQGELSRTQARLSACNIEHASCNAAIIRLKAEPHKPVVIEKVRECPPPPVCTTGETPIAAIYTVFFGYGKTDFVATPEMLLKENLDEMRKAKRIDVRARTDAERDSPGNQTVVAARAANAVDWLLKVGVPKESIYTNIMAFGDLLPDKEKSRRVEILVHGVTAQGD